MKREKLVTIKTTQAERDAWKRVAASRGTMLGTMIRQYMRRQVAQMEKQQK